MKGRSDIRGAHRSYPLAKRDAQEKKSREEMMTPDDMKAKKEAEAKDAKEKAKTTGRKLPSLRRAEDDVAPGTTPSKKK